MPATGAVFEAGLTIVDAEEPNPAELGKAAERAIADLIAQQMPSLLRLRGAHACRRSLRYCAKCGGDLAQQDGISADPGQVVMFAFAGPDVVAGEPVRRKKGCMDRNTAKMALNVALAAGGTTSAHAVPTKLGVERGTLYAFPEEYRQLVDLRRQQNRPRQPHGRKSSEK